MSKEKAKDLVEDLPAWMAGYESNNQNLLRPIANEIDNIDTDVTGVDLAQNVQTAEGGELDKLGKLVNIHRFDGEPDNVFRSRVFVGFLANVSSGTRKEIRKAIGIVLNINPETVTIIEWYDVGDDATISVAVPDGSIEDRALTESQFIGVIERIVAAGVTLKIHTNTDVLDTHIIAGNSEAQMDEIGPLKWDVGMWDVDYYG